MKRINRWVLVLLMVILVIGVWSTFAFAISPSEVDESDTLEVSIRTSDGTTILHTYEKSEMEDLAEGKNIAYSSIDNGGFTVRTIASGVYVKDLLDDVQQYTDIDVWDFYRLIFAATDGAIGSFKEDDLFDIRYYYPNLEKYGLNEYGEIDYDPGEPTLVEPMLAMDAEQQRLPEDDNRGITNPEQYTILFGMSEDELEDVERRTSDFKRGVCKLVIDMGSYVVNDDDVTGVSLDHSEVEINVGKKLQLTATISPDTAANKDVSWESSNTSVATVSSSGLVSGLSSGTAVITATSDADDTISASCTITVSSSSGGSRSGSVDVSGIVLDKSTVTLAVGGEKTLIATVSPSDADDHTVTWKSRNSGIATVNANGLVKGITEGVTEITATAGSYSAVCTVTVSNTIVAVNGINLNYTVLTLSKEQQYQLTPTISPANSTNKTVYWSSDSPGVVTVDTSGLVTAKNIGSAVVSVSTEDSSFSASCKVTVSETASLFSDISGNWAENEIKKMVDFGFTSGYSDGTFHPSNTITRAEFLSMLIRVLEKTKDVELESDSTFDDTASHWAKDYISTAVSLGITSGYGDGNFGPNDNITREQIALMLSMAAGYEEGTQSDLSFTDSGEISAWAKGAVSFTSRERLFGGYDDGSFGPKKNATRAEACALLLRFYEKMNAD